MKSKIKRQGLYSNSRMVKGKLRIKVAHKHELPGIVDELGKVLAKKADLEIQEQYLKSLLDKSGLDEVEGRTFRATISRFERRTTDYRAVAGELCEVYRVPNSDFNRMVEDATHAKAVVTVKVGSR